MTRAVHAVTAMALSAFPQLVGAARDIFAFNLHLERANLTDGCSDKGEGDCGNKPTCLWRPKGNPKCAPAIPVNCPGVKHDACDKVPELCHWDYKRANEQWEKACFPGPAESTEQPACVLRTAEQPCTAQCLWRPNKELHCAPKLAKYCQGVRQAQCQQEAETCHWEFTGDLEHACKGGKAESKPQPKHTICEEHHDDSDKCMQDLQCMFRPQDPKAKCAKAISKNCKGMNSDACKKFTDKCEWDYKRANEKWQDACFPKKTGSSSSIAKSTTATTKTTTTSTKSTTTSPVQAVADCHKREATQEGCLKDKKCFLRPKGEPKCIDALPKNCIGMNQKDCGMNTDKCHWNFKDYGVWTEACRPGASDGDKKPVKPHDPNASSPSSTSKISSTSSTTSSTSTSSSTSGAANVGPGALAVLVVARAFLA